MTPASDVFNTDRSQAPKRTRRRLAAGIAVIVILPSLMVLSAVRTVRPVAASGSNTYYTTDIAPTNPVIHFTMNSNGGTTWAPRAPLPSDGDGLCSTWPGYDPAEYSDRQGHVYGTRTSGENGVVGGSCMPQNAMPSPLPNDSEENQGTLQPDAGGSSASPGLLGTTLPTFASCAGVVGTCYPNVSAYNQYPVTDQTGSFLMNFWMQFGVSNWCATQSSGCSGETFLIWTNGVAGCCPGPRFGVWTSDSLQTVCFGNQYGSVQNGDVECLTVPNMFDTWQMISLRYNGPAQTVSLYWNALQQGTALHFPASLWNQSAFANIGKDDTGAIDNHQLRIVSDGFWSYTEWVGSAADALVAPCGPGNSLCPSGSGSCNPSTNNACSYLGYLYNATGTGESPDTQQHALQGGPVTQAETAGPPNCSCSNPNLGQDTSGDPVNTSSGNFSETVTDLSIPGRGIPLAFTRTYNSAQAGVSGPLGYGWASNSFMSLSQPGGTGLVTIAQEGGAQIVFDPSGAGYAPTAPRDIDTLSHNGDATWTFVRRAMDTFTFSSTGLLVSEKDQNGYTTTFGYNGSNQLTTVTDPAQRSITLGWTGGNVSTITDPNVSPARQVTLQYNDGAGNLTDVIDLNGGHSRFVYDTSHRLTKMYDPNCYAAGSACNGGNGVVNGYNGTGQVGSQQDQLGRTTTFSYTGDPTSAAGGTTTVTDPMTNVVVDTYQYGVLTAETKGYGTASAATWSYTYDPNSAGLATVTDPNGNTTRYFRDASGNQVGEIDPLGRYTSAAYNSFNEPLTQTDALGVTTTSVYDTSGNLNSVSTPLVGSGQTRTTTYTYGDISHPGDVTKMQDPDQFNWFYTYDAYGDRATVTDPMSDISTTCYNADGWKLASYSPKAGSITCAVPPPASPYETTYSYVQPNNQIDEFGDVQKVTDPLGHATSTTYDADRNVVSNTDAGGNLTRYTFDLANEQTDVVRADQSDLHTDYNLDGTIHDQKDGKGNPIQTYGYDPLARVTSVSGAVSDTTSYTFDGAGNQLSQQDPGGNCTAMPATGCTKMTYDAANELVGVTYSDGVTPNVSNITYDADGQRTGTTDGTGPSSWSWDSLHRLISFTDGHNDQVQYQYNLRGLITKITYPGGLPVQRGYDNAGRWNSVQDWLGNTTSFGYDANNNLTTTTLPASTSTVDTTGYNAADQSTSITDVTNSTPLFSATYGRDNAGQVASDSSLPSGVAADRYTSLNQLCYAGSSTANACATPPAGAQEYGFDAADNLTNANGTTQAFNAADELCWTVSGSSRNGCSSAPTSATTYSYDPRGNRTTVTPSSGSATHLGYDQANRLSSYGQGSTTTAIYAYNGDGLRMSKTVSGVTSPFTWDVVSSPAALLSDGTSDYVYGPGNLVLEQITPQPAISLVGTATASGKSASLTLTLPAGVQTNDQVFVATTEPSSTTVTAPYGYTSVASVSSTGGTTPSTTTVYRHAVANGDTAVTLTYSSNKTAQAAVLAVYRGIDPSAPVDVSATASTSSGTMVTAPSVTTTYGSERLAVFQGAAGRFSGKSWTAPSGTTEQAQSNATANASMGIADQTLGAAGATGTRVSTFGASANLTTVMLATPTPPVLLFAHADQLGSTRLLTDLADVIRGSFTYDPYGNVTASSGSSSIPFKFAGQYKDAETGFYYLHARYYDPATAQFLSRDPAVGKTRSPYAYAAGDPLNATDPTGLVTCSGQDIPELSSCTNVHFKTISVTTGDWLQQDILFWHNTKKYWSVTMTASVWYNGTSAGLVHGTQQHSWDLPNSGQFMSDTSTLNAQGAYCTGGGGVEVWGNYTSLDRSLTLRESKDIHTWLRIDVSANGAVSVLGGHSYYQWGHIPSPVYDWYQSRG